MQYQSGVKALDKGRKSAAEVAREELGESTELRSELPWSRSGSPPVREHLSLTLAWYPDEPARVGQTAVVSRCSSLGRGVGDGREPRLEFMQQRPGASEPRGSLNSPRLSRAQLRLEPQGDRLRVENVGRCVMLHNGAVAEEALVAPGETLTLADTAVFCLETRSALWPEAASARQRAFDFGSPDEDGIIGESSAAWQLRAEIDAAASGSSHVLIHGASGAGKELAAQAIHRSSARRAGPFVSRNAATLPPGLIDAELFGNIKNYPNAGSPERAGLVGEAEGGTLLLDEIGELPVAEQAHLLRLLDKGGEYQRLGDARVRRANVRVIALTNRDAGALKPDVLARFPVRIRVPSFNERPADIPLFLRHVVQDIGRSEPALMERFGAAGTGPFEPLVEPRLVELLLRHPLAGNYRELEQLARLALTTSTGRYLQATSRVMEALGGEEGGRDAQLDREAPQLDREGLLAALEAAGGSPTLAAQRLGLKNRHVLYRLMKKYEIESKG